MMTDQEEGTMTESRNVLETETEIEIAIAIGEATRREIGIATLDVLHHLKYLIAQSHLLMKRMLL